MSHSLESHDAMPAQRQGHSVLEQYLHRIQRGLFCPYSHMTPPDSDLYFCFCFLHGIIHAPLLTWSKNDGDPEIDWDVKERCSEFLVSNDTTQDPLREVCWGGMWRHSIYSVLSCFVIG